MWSKAGGVWVPATDAASAKRAGAWSRHKAMHARVSGAWRQLVPPNCIVMYAAAAPAGTAVCDGTLGTPDLLNLFPRNNLAKAPLDLDGASLSHAGSSHGPSGAVNTGAGPIVPASNAIGFTSGAFPYITPATHYHSLGAHSHDAIEITPDIPIVDVVPTVGGDVIFPDAIIPTISDPGSLSWLIEVTSDASFLNRYARFAAAFASSGSAFDHEHGSASLYTGDWSRPTDQLQPNSGSWAWNHRHSANHTMPGIKAGEGKDGPVSLHARAFKVTSKAYFDQLPSGAVMLFLSEDYPEGWTAISSAQLLRFTTATLDEKDTHIHSGTKTTGDVSTVTSKAGSAGSSGNEMVIRAHTHAWTDTHATPVGSVPPSIVLRFAVKD